MSTTDSPSDEVEREGAEAPPKQSPAADASLSSPPPEATAPANEVNPQAEAQSDAGDREAPLATSGAPSPPANPANERAMAADAWLWRVITFLFAWFILTDRLKRGGDNAWTWAVCAPALWLMLRPGSRPAVAALGVAQIAWYSTTYFGKTYVHWFIQAVANTFFLTTLATVLLWSVARDRRLRAAPADLIATLRGPGRWFVAVGMFFTGVAKLNESFLDPAISCGAVYYRWLLTQPIIGSVLPSGSAGNHFAIAMAVSCELAGPALLLFRRTRPIGLGLLWVLFMGLFLNPRSHYFEFAGLFFCFTLLWLSPSTVASARESLTRFLGLFDRLRGKLPTTSRAPPWPVMTLVLVATFMIGGTLMNRHFRLELARVVSVTIVALTLVVGIVAGTRLHWRLPVPRVPKLVPAAAWGITVLFLLNEAAPYVGLRHSPTLTMAANLRLNATASNHIIFDPPWFLPFSRDVTIVEGSAGPLRPGRHAPWPYFVDTLARYPDAAVKFRRSTDGPVETLSGSDIGWWPSRVLAKVWKLGAYGPNADKPIVCDKHPPEMSKKEWRAYAHRVIKRWQAAERAKKPPG